MAGRLWQSTRWDQHSEMGQHFGCWLLGLRHLHSRFQIWLGSYWRKMSTAAMVFAWAVDC
jgi:hypothetical protein